MKNREQILSSGGFLRKQQPTQSDVHVDSLLTNISVAHFQREGNFIARRAAPTIMVAKQSDKYITFPRGYFNRDLMAKRADCTESQRVGYAVSTDSYLADVWSLGHDVGDQRRANTDSPMNPDREAVQLLTGMQLIREDALWMSEFFGTGIWATDLTGVASGAGAGQFNRWDGTSDPVLDIEAGRLVMEASTGYSPNTLVLDRRVYGKLKTNASILDRLKYSGGVSNARPAQVFMESLAQLFEVDQILVPRGIVNSAAEGVTDVHGFQSGKHALLCYVAPSPGLYEASAMYTFRWSGLTGGVGGSSISRFREDRRKCDVIEIDSAFDLKKVSADLGVFYNGAIV
jgi:hypothetical protein